MNTSNEKTISRGEAEEALRLLLSYIGEDPDRLGLKGTPDRILRMWEEIYRGYIPAKSPKITTFQNGADGLVYDNMVVDTGDFYSMCEHHTMPFFGQYWFAYIPNPKGKILGISKIGRVVDYCSARLQIQERLAPEIDRERFVGPPAQNLLELDLIYDPSIIKAVLPIGKDDGP